MSPTLKQQPINHRVWRCSKAMHGLFLSAKLSGCQFLPPKLLPPSHCPPILSCHTVFSSTSSHRHVVEVVVVVGGGGFIDARETRRLALTNELSGQTSSEWE